MKFEKQIKAGGARRSVNGTSGKPPVARCGGSRLALAIAVFIVTGAAAGQSLYKYQDENGEWIYTDRPPPAEQTVEIRALPTGSKPPTVSITTRITDHELQFVARNEYFAHVEVVLALDEFTNVESPAADQAMRWVLEPRSELEIMTLAASGGDQAPAVKFRYLSLHGDPRSQHAPRRPYRAPFAVASDHNVTQAFPLGVTHNTTDSRYAVDFAMPVGTDIHAARGGVVFEVASTNFRGGTDREGDAPAANIVRILHDDGTHAVYAHLNWNSIRVQPGDEVERGEYIADSGNTGFSSGPHLHFAVLKNVGMRIDSVPVTFEGPNSAEIRPTAGISLTAY